MSPSPFVKQEPTPPARSDPQSPRRSSARISCRDFVPPALAGVHVLRVGHCPRWRGLNSRTSYVAFASLLIKGKGPGPSRCLHLHHLRRPPHSDASIRSTRSYRCFKKARKLTTPSNGEYLQVHQHLVELLIQEIVQDLKPSPDQEVREVQGDAWLILANSRARRAPGGKAMGTSRRSSHK